MSKMSLIPKYTLIQKVINRVFYPSENSITIFTEDKPSDRVLYEIIIDRLIKDEVIINKIIPLGPKSKVIEKSIKAKSKSNPSLFIVDADIGILDGEQLEDSNLISLNRYCIENYLCCELALIEYLYVKLGGDKKTLKNNIDFDNKINKNFSTILKLYTRYYLSQELDMSIKFKCFNDFISNTGHSVSKQKVNSEINLVEKEIKKHLKSMGVKTYKKEMEIRLEEINAKIKYDSFHILNFLSGKDQLLPFLRKLIFYLDKSSRGLDNDQLKRLLAEKFDINNLLFLKEKIVSIAN